MAWACLACLAATGCAQSGLLSQGKWGTGEPVHVTRSRSAPRPEIVRAAGSPATGVAVVPASARLANLRSRAAQSLEDDAQCDLCSCDGGDVACGEGCDGAAAGGGCGPHGCALGGAGGGLRGGQAGGCGPGCLGAGCGRCRMLACMIASGGCCGPHGPGGICPHRGGYPEQTSFNQGPAVGQVAYPYYTVRGPRDFLRNNPPTIGPY